MLQLVGVEGEWQVISKEQTDPQVAPFSGSPRSINPNGRRKLEGFELDGDLCSLNIVV